MSRRTGVEVAIIILALGLLGAGCWMLIFPEEMVFYHQGAEDLPSYFESVSRNGVRVYGGIGVLAALGLMWFACRPAKGVQGRAIERFVWRLPQDLVKRFGAKRSYTVDEVTRTARDAGYDMAFIAYAHAILCNRQDFDAYYEPLRVRCTYDGLRATVSKRYFGGTRDFDAETLIRVSKEPNPESNTHCESSL